MTTHLYTELSEIMQGPLKDWFTDEAVFEWNLPFIRQLDELLHSPGGVMRVDRPRGCGTTSIMLATALHAATTGVSRATVVVTRKWHQAHWRSNTLFSVLRDRFGLRPHHRKCGVIELPGAVLDVCPMRDIQGKSYWLDAHRRHMSFGPDLVLIDGIVCRGSPKEHREPYERLIDDWVSQHRPPRTAIVDTV